MRLTLCAAWRKEDTQILIDILGRYGVKATFFTVGQWADRYAESMKSLHDGGHEVMNHSDQHPHMPRLSVREITAEVGACNDKVEAVTRVRPTLFRCPHGEYNDNVISDIRAMGMNAMQWDVDCLD